MFNQYRSRFSFKRPQFRINRNFMIALVATLVIALIGFTVAALYLGNDPATNAQGIQFEGNPRTANNPATSAYAAWRAQYLHTTDEIKGAGWEAGLQTVQKDGEITLIYGTDTTFLAQRFSGSNSKTIAACDSDGDGMWFCKTWGDVIVTPFEFPDASSTRPAPVLVH